MSDFGVAATEETTSSAVRSDRSGVFAVYAIYAAEGLSFAAVTSRAPEIQLAHGLSDDAINLLVACVPATAVAGGLLAARVAARFGPGPLLRCAQVLFHASVLAVGVVRGVPALVVTLVALALSVGALDAAMNAQAVAVQARAGRSVVNGFFAVWSAMGIAGSLWISLANGTGVSLPAGFALPAAVGLLVALATVRFRLPAEDRAAACGLEEPACQAVPWRPLLVIGGVLACAYVAEGAVMGFAVKYVQGDLRGSAAVAPLAIAAFALTTVLGRSLADRAIGRWGAPRLVRAGALVTTAGLLAVAAAPGPAVAIGGFALAGLGLCSMAPSAYAAAGRHDPGGRGVAVARVGIFNYIGFVCGTAMVAAVHPLSGYRAGYAVAATALVVVAALAGRLASGPVQRHRRLATS
ncbi:MFS transporter [Actinomadura litoris]|uniref:MFS transporter n=1 Tax=Actinomadura litoris TaxID=2678616 RepID=UPI001FA71447|nr:MFS transporter [Actinomadura litoris]